MRRQRRGGRRARLPQDDFNAEILDLTHDGRGIARDANGKTVMIDGALPGEQVAYRLTARRSQYDEARLVEVQTPSAERIDPLCPHFGLCGGCSLQHLPPAAQLQHKQHWLAQCFERIGRVAPQRWLPALEGPHWEYRRRARLAVRYVHGKGRVLVGFRERHAPYVADLSRCAVLHPDVGQRLLELSALIGTLSIRERLPQIEVAVAENLTALCLRVLDLPTETDRARLIEFAREQQLALLLQPGGPDSLVPLYPDPMPALYYRLPDYNLEFQFLPQHFTQVNFELNRAMIDHALGLLALQPQERVLDLFCGLGNFSLPLARHAGMVVGVEGEKALVQHAALNAAHNGLSDRAQFHCLDLTQDAANQPWLAQGFDAVVLDPPRSGAEHCLPWLLKCAPSRMLYVSCHPASLARDAAILCAGGYRLEAAGVMDMFPHTAHVESMALFVRD